MKKNIFINSILLFGILFFSLVCIKAEDKNNKLSKIDSVWEYEPGEYDRMTFTMFKDGKFVFENTNSKKKYKGIWEFNSEHTQIIISFISDKSHWDKVFFEDKSFLDKRKKEIGYYNKSERKIGLIIYEESRTKEKYIGFLGFVYHKK